MNGGRGPRLLVRAIVIGLLLAVMTSRGELISLQTWLVGSTAVMGTLTVLRLIERSSHESPRTQPLWSRSTPPISAVPRRLRGIEATLQHGCHHPRAHANQLRPRLRALARHGLRVSHGIDLDTDTGRANDVLGDVAWLIDADSADRAPTIDEIDTFLNRALGSTPETTSQ
jgi:hypothetical protein